MQLPKATTLRTNGANWRDLFPDQPTSTSLPRRFRTPFSGRQDGHQRTGTCSQTYPEITSHDQLQSTKSLRQTRQSRPILLSRRPRATVVLPSSYPEHLVAPTPPQRSTDRRPNQRRVQNLTLCWRQLDRTPAFRQGSPGASRSLGKPW